MKSKIILILVLTTLSACSFRETDWKTKTTIVNSNNPYEKFLAFHGRIDMGASYGVRVSYKAISTVKECTTGCN